jgi:hypothetical protein
VSADALRTCVEPLFATPAHAKNLERFILAIDNRANVEAEPLLRRLTAPTLVVWGIDDLFFGVEWAHWLAKTIPGTRRVVELPGARLFFPEERADELAAALREHWAAADALRPATGSAASAAAAPVRLSIRRRGRAPPAPAGAGADRRAEPTGMARAVPC